MKRIFSVVMGCALITIACAVAVNALSVNQTISNLNIRDANDNPASLPAFGSKVLTIFYNDAEASDISDPISDALKAQNFPESKTLGIGIANLKDSAAPNWLIRKMVQRKIAKYNATILTDVDNTVANVWGLGSCDNKSICVIIGKDKKVKYMKYFDKHNPATQGDINTIVSLVGEQVNK